MAKQNTAIEVTFFDNSGRAGWRYSPAALLDVTRHWRIFGVWRTRWILFKQFWRALKLLEDYCDNTGKLRKAERKWIFKSVIPE